MDSVPQFPSRGEGAEFRLLVEADAESFLWHLLDTQEDLAEWFDWLVDELCPVDPFGARPERSLDECFERCRIFIQEELTRFRARRGLTMGIWHNGVLAGAVRISEIEQRFCAEITFWLNREHRKRGLIVTACAAVLDYLFSGAFAVNGVDVGKAHIFCTARNRDSNNVPRKLGFVLEGLLRDACRDRSGDVHDEAAWGVTKKEWKEWSVRGPLVPPD